MDAAKEWTMNEMKSMVISDDAFDVFLDKSISIRIETRRQ